MNIHFIQYVLPHGRKVHTIIDRPQNIAEKAKIIKDQGYRFEIEILTTDEVAMTIFDPEIEEDLAIEICQNNEEVPKTVDKMINEFYEHHSDK